MGDMVAVGSALYSACAGLTATPVYYALAPQGGTPPYVVIGQQAGVDEYTFTGRDLNSEYQVMVISDRGWPTEAATIYDNLHGQLNGRALTVAGYTALRCERTATIEYRDTDGYWHVGGLYRVDVHKT
jgi:hypothetical protein